MKRKLVKQGAATMMVSLPAKWIKTFNLRKGDEINLDEQGRDLLISASKTPEIEKKQLSLLGKQPNRTVRRYIGTSYKKGYDEIIVKFDSPNTIQTIEKFIPDLLGFEIVEQKENSCIIKNVASALENQFDSMLRRTFLILLSIGEDSLKAAKKSNFEYLKKINRLDKNINKFTDVCKRLLIKNNVKFKESYFYYAVSAYLELIGNEYKYIADYFGDY